MSNPTTAEFKQIEFNSILEPFEQFRVFLDFAKRNSVREFDAMTLATVGADGLPSVRVLYMKELSDDGLIFYTNYEGRKSIELNKNPKSCVNFFWPEVFIQVRIFGETHKVSREKSEAYFKTRPRVSQLGAWASHQSQEMPNYDHLLTRLSDFEKKFEGVEVPCPEGWGGYCLIPFEFEFWIGREGRLHERYCYRKKDPQSLLWTRFMRSP